MSDLAVLIRQLQGRLTGIEIGIKFGQVAAFNWSGTDVTTVTVTHGLGVVPSAVIASNGGHDPGDARSPWVTSVGNVTATTFDVTMATRNNATIGVYAVAAHQRPYWVAIA